MTEERDDEFQVKQALLRADIRIQQNRPKPIDYLVTKCKDPLFLLELSRGDKEELYKETMQFEALQQTVWWKAVNEIIDYDLQDKSGIDYDITKMMVDKTLEELIELELHVKQRLDSDYDYWDRVLQTVVYYKARLIVSEIYQKAQLQPKEKKEDQNIPKIRFISEPYDPSMEPAMVSDIMFRDAKIPIITQGEFDTQLNLFREKLKNDLVKYGGKKLVHTHGNRKKDITFMKKSLKNLENDELILASDILFDEDYKLMEKYSARKPIYFVRVETGLVWIENKKKTKKVSLILIRWFWVTNSIFFILIWLIHFWRLHID
jgi:hypothetical protein